MDDLNFAVRAGVVVREGKSVYPHRLNLHMTRRDALDLLVVLANQLRDESAEELDFGFVGRLTEADND